jgi:TolB-like protein
MSNSGKIGLFQELKRRNVFRVAIAFVIAAWLLLQLTDILVPMLSLPEWVGRLVFLLLVIAFPISLLFAWAFEMTAEGVKLEKNVDRSESITQVTGRRIDFLIIGVLVAALGISMYVNFKGAGSSESAVESVAEDLSGDITEAVTQASIAVLPFANRSADESDVFFVDGMHDDLLTQLAKISALKVISRTSVMQYRDTEKSMKDIGVELGVKTLLEGGVQRAGNRIRINVQLIDTETDEHLWAETYNRELTTDNIFEIQEEISLEIAGALHAALSPEEQQRISDRPTDNMKAYEAYMLGRQRLATRNSAAVAESIDYFRIAIREDENFADAYASLAEAFMVQNNGGTISLQEMLEHIRPLVAKASELTQESGIVFNAMGGLAEYEGDLELAEAFYRKAIEVSPSYTTAYVWLGLLHLNYTGDFEEAARLYQTASELDPMAALPRYNLATQLSALGRYEEAMAEIEKGIEIDPTVSQSYTFGGELLAFGFGRVADGIVWVQKSVELDESNRTFLPYFYLSLGDFESARIWRNSFDISRIESGFAKEQEIALLRSEGKIQEAAEVAISLLSHSRDTVSFPYLLQSIRDYYLRVERENEALELYQEFFPELFLDRPNANRANLQVAVDLVHLLRRVGEEAEASKLADLTFPVLTEAPIKAGSTNGRGLLEVELYAILGERDKAIDALIEVVNSGWFTYQSPLNPAPNLSSIADDPEYLRLMGVIQQRVDAELLKVRDMEQNGQLARTPADLVNITFD